MADIRFYISGHGLGHASRTCQVINTLRQMAPQLRVEVVTTAHAWFLASHLDPGVSVRALALDVGVLQQDSLVMLERETLAQCRDLQPEIESRAFSEAESLRRNEVRLVVGDIPATAFLAAERAGVPGVGLANFSWDWIYRHFNRHLGGYEDVVEAQMRDYQRADLFLRLPFYGPCEPFKTIENVPMIARVARLGRYEVCERLGLPGDRRLALLSFGGFGLDGLNLAPLESRKDWLILGEIPLKEAPSNYCHVPRGLVEYPDLVAAADVVVTKPGYGIVSETIANNTAVVYTPRGDFPEQPILEQALETYTRSLRIENRALRGGEWAEALEEVLRRPAPASRLAANGDRVVARRLLAMVDRTG